MFEPIENNHINGGTQQVYRFPNGYGASVICSPTSFGGSQGLSELAVVCFKDADTNDFDLVYYTPITSDVLGYLEEDEVRETLERISALGENEKAAMPQTPEPILGSVRDLLIWYGGNDFSVGDLRRHLSRSGDEGVVLPPDFDRLDNGQHVSKSMFADILYLTFKAAEENA